MTLEEKRKALWDYCLGTPSCDECVFCGTGEWCSNYAWMNVPEDVADEAFAKLYGQPSKVDHPSHYNQGNIECIDAMVAAYGKDNVQIFCLLNAFKYLWRAEHKNGKEDLDKAIWYLKKHKELESNG